MVGEADGVRVAGEVPRRSALLPPPALARVAEVAPTRKTWEPVETRLVAEYLAMVWPDARTRQRVRVGRTPAELPLRGLDESELAALGVWRRWVDAVVELDDRTILIEAAVVPDPGKISQLDLYRYLYPLTPEFYDRRRLPVDGLLLCAVDDPVFRRIAADRGYGVYVYRPPWLDGYFDRLFPRQRRAPLPSG
jgi:hypothetical protein